MKEKIAEPKVPPEDQVKEFWQTMWADDTDHKKRAGWILKERKRIQECKVEQMINHKISTNELKTALRKQHNWKTAGKDGIQNF